MLELNGHGAKVTGVRHECRVNAEPQWTGRALATQQQKHGAIGLVKRGVHLE